MADEPDDELLLENEIVDDADADDPENGDAAGDDTDEDDGVILLGDEEPPEVTPETGLVKDLRKRLRDTQKQLRERETGQAAPQAVDPGPKPTLESCGWDGEKLSDELDAWHERNASAKQAQAEQERVQGDAKRAWGQREAAYTAEVAKLPIAGKDEAIETAEGALSQAQRAIIIKGCANPALVMAGLGKHPQRLSTLAGMEDLVDFTFAVAKLQGELKMSSKRPPAVDKPVRGSAPNSGSSDKQLERLEAEASRSGDRSKIIAYKASRRNAA